MPYAAPLDDIRFLLNRIAPVARLTGLPRYAHVDASDAERGRSRVQATASADRAGRMRVRERERTRRE